MTAPSRLGAGSRAAILTMLLVGCAAGGCSADDASAAAGGSALDAGGEMDVSGPADGGESSPDGGPAEDGGGPDARADAGASPAPARLSFVDPVGDDGLSCGTWCAVHTTPGVTAELAVSYHAEGDAKDGKLVTFTRMGSEPEGLGWLSASSAWTDAEGVARVSAAAAAPGQAPVSDSGVVTVRVDVPKDGTAPRYFDLVVTPTGVVPLTLASAYVGDEPVAKHRVTLHKPTGCGDTKGLLEGEPLHATPLLPLAQPGRFLNIDDLEPGSAKSYTVVVEGLGDDGERLAWHCGAVDTVGGGSASQTLALQDLPLGVGGVWQWQASLPVAQLSVGGLVTPFDGLTAYIASPAQTLVDMVCELGGQDDILQAWCGLMVIDPSAYGGGGLTALGAAALAVWQAHEVEALEGTPWAAVASGEEVAGEALTTIEMRGSWTLAAEPLPGNAWPSGASKLRVDALAALGADPAGQACSPWSTAPTCPEVVTPVTEVDGVDAPVTVSVPASFTGAQAVAIQPFTLPLDAPASLGAVLKHTVPGWLLGDPSVPPALSSLVWPVIGGGDCGFGAQSCCGAFAESLLASDLVEEGRLDGPWLQAACAVLAETLAASFDEALSPMAGAWKVSADEACPALDVDGDGQADQLGAPESPCGWTFAVTLGDETLSLDAELAISR